jgi:hypothetical protein
MKKSKNPKYHLEPSNFDSLISHIKPTVPSCTSHKDCFILQQLWNYFDLPYGHEIPITISKKAHFAYFVPYLSALQIFKNGDLLFEFFETERNDLRSVFANKLKSLCESNKHLQDLHLCDIDTTKSWFSVLWIPILSNYNTMNYIKGEFLTLYKLNPNVEIFGCLPSKVIMETWFYRDKNDGFITPSVYINNTVTFLKDRKITHPDFESLSDGNYFLN